MVATNRVNQESDEETNSSEGNENILQDGEENEHEQNHYENGIEDDVVLSNDEQNVTNTEKHVEQLEELQQQQQPQEEQHEEEQQEKEQKGEEVAEEVKLESLPEEILDMIVNLSMTGHNRTIIDTYDALSHTSTTLKRLVSRYIRRLPKISASRDMYPGLRSMRQILKQYERGSGLVSALKEIINSPQWISAWINVLFTGVGTWMYVTAIFWKKGKK